MEEHHSSQAARVIARFGSTYKLAQALSEALGREVYRSTVARWRMSRDRGGTGGHIPVSMHRAVLAAARARGVRLRLEDMLIIDPEELQ